LFAWSAERVPVLGKRIFSSPNKGPYGGWSKNGLHESFEKSWERMVNLGVL